VSSVRFFDERSLRLARWVSARYVAPLASVLDRLSPPRVAGEEDPIPPSPGARALPRGWPPPAGGPVAGYRGGTDLLDVVRRGKGAFMLRPAPEDETAAAVEVVASCLAGGRRALVLVPEASPRPATAGALEEAFGERVTVFAGGDRRTRYRTWLRIAAGAADVVVGTRPAVYAPVQDLGLIYVSRESHPGHREDRSPAHHARDVALTRARFSGAALVLEASCPSAEAAVLGLRTVAAPRDRWPKVEVVKPGVEGRAPRLVEALRASSRAFVYTPLRGYGVAQVCRSCGAPAACHACGGALRIAEGRVRCIVCEADGRCASCDGSRFGIRRGGAERVVEWASAVAPVAVREVGRPRLPRANEILVGGPEDIRDLGPGGLELVAILDADLAARRPGLAARERAVATWMEAVGWARPAGRAILQASDPSDPAIQAVVRGNADRFLERERARRAEAGFPVGAAVFRVIGDERLADAIRALPAITSLVTSLAGRTVCLLALEPAVVDVFGGAMRELAGRGIVERVEAEPHL
jgi:primosomal protein N' (replication factor Y)